jgi:hypothetical protein
LEVFMPSRVFRCLATVAFVSTVAACHWTVVDHGPDDGFTASPATCGRAGESSTTGSAPASCDVKVDRWKELLVTHRSVLLDRRAQNDVADATWSFRHMFEELAGDATGAAALTHAWLEQWKTVTVVGPDRAPVTPRPSVGPVLLDPWRAADGGALSSAPFRLIAIVNRPDLRAEASACHGAAGEIRFVYSAVDPVTRKAIPMTIIVEIPYPTTRSAREWIEAWHALATRPFGDAYNAALAALTSEVIRDSNRESWLVRTNEIALGEPDGLPWEMREFALGADAAQLRRLAQLPIATTPRIELDRSASLDSWAKENEARILDGSYVLPGGFQAGAAPIARSWFRWSSQSLDPKLLDALSKATCNGCHGGERIGETALPFQHIAAADQRTAYYVPANDGETRVSTWLNDPSGYDDELGRRERSVAQALCETCASTGSSETGTPYRK